LNDLPAIKPLHVIYAANRVFHKQYEGAYCFMDAIVQQAFKHKTALRGEQTMAQQAKEFIGLLKKYIGDALDSADQDNIYRQLMTLSIAAPEMEKIVEAFYKQVKPKLVVVEDGNYGGIEPVTLIYVAKKLKIPTAEIQHGVFDVAFKYEDKLLQQPAFSQHKTDFVLTFGDYFTQYVHSSSRNISIGNYYLNKKVTTCRLLQ
jgi:hypothetical protein